MDMAQLTQGIKGIDKKVEIFEKAQDDEIGDKTEQQPSFFHALLLGLFNFQADKKIDHGGEGDERQKAPIPETVKEITADKEEQRSDFFCGIDAPLPAGSSGESGSFFSS